MKRDLRWPKNKREERFDQKVPRIQRVFSFFLHSSMPRYSLVMTQWSQIPSTGLTSLFSFLFSWHVLGSKEGLFFLGFFWYLQSWSSSPQPICWHLLSLSVEVITKGTKGVNPITLFCSETAKRKQSYTSKIMSNISSHVVLTRCLSTSAV